MKSNVPGITRVGAIAAASLQPDIRLQAIAGLRVELFVKPLWLKGIKRAKIEIEESESAGDRVQSAKLTFFTTEEMQVFEPSAFVAVTADGRAIMVGTAEPPFPAVKTVVSTGLPGSDASGIEYEITHTAKKAVIEVGL